MIFVTEQLAVTLQVKVELVVAETLWNFPFPVEAKLFRLLGNRPQCAAQRVAHHEGRRERHGFRVVLVQHRLKIMLLAIVDPVGHVQREIVGGRQIEQIPEIKQAVRGFLVLAFITVATDQLRLFQCSLRLVVTDYPVVPHLGGDILEVEKFFIVLDGLEQALTDKHFQLVRMIGVSSGARAEFAFRVEQFADLTLQLLQLVSAARAGPGETPDVESDQQDEHRQRERQQFVSG